MQKIMLYVGLFSFDQFENKYIRKLDDYLKNYILDYFDIANIFDIDNLNLNKYKLVIINAIILNSEIVSIDKDNLQKKMENLSKIDNIVMYLHDLHDYSFYPHRDIFVGGLKIINGIQTN